MKNSIIVVEPSCPPSFVLSEPEPFGKKGKILVCDDEKFNCDIVYGFLMILGI